MINMEKAYSSDLTDEEYNLIKEFIPSAKFGGRPRTTDIRLVINAIMYKVKTGCQWRLLPHDFPPWETVYDYYKLWKEDGTWERIHNEVRNNIRKKLDINPDPTYGIMDSQSIKSSNLADSSGYDAAKKNQGKKKKHYCR